MDYDTGVMDQSAVCLDQSTEGVAHSFFLHYSDLSHVNNTYTCPKIAVRALTYIQHWTQYTEHVTDDATARDVG